MKCAKAELQRCGGASDISGKCGEGLQCLKTCLPCNTVGDAGLPCIFPFIYQNQTYNKCTPRDSDTRQPWCATAVDSDNVVIDYAWGDCAEGCPGTRVECDDRYFSIEDGVCIDVSVPGAIPNWVGAPTVKLERPTEVLFPAPVCKNRGASRREYANTCRCDRGETALDFDSQGTPRGNCTGLDENEGDNLDKVWCFLENIRDPQDARSGCYSDTTWSSRDGRYWSALACTQAPDIGYGPDLSSSTQQINRQQLPQVRSRPRPGPRISNQQPATTTTTTTTSTTTTQASVPELPRSSFISQSKQAEDFDLYDYYDEIFNYDDFKSGSEDYASREYEEYTVVSEDDFGFRNQDLNTESTTEAAREEEEGEQFDSTDSFVFIPETTTGTVQL
jgi:hypothetical protein